MGAVSPPRSPPAGAGCPCWSRRVPEAATRPGRALVVCPELRADCGARARGRDRASECVGDCGAAARELIACWTAAPDGAPREIAWDEEARGRNVACCRSAVDRSVTGEAVATCADGSGTPRAYSEVSDSGVTTGSGICRAGCCGVAQLRRAAAKTSVAAPTMTSDRTPVIDTRRHP
jgi:hypothetical protein